MIIIILSIAICVLKVVQKILDERDRREDEKIDVQIREIEEEIKRLEAKELEED